MAKRHYRVNVSVITPELYAEMKKKLHAPSDDESVMKEYKIGKTTAQTIRRTANYSEYRARGAERKKAQRKLEMITQNATYDRLADNGKKTEPEQPNLLARIVGVLLLLCLILIVVGITVGVVRWALRI